MIAYCDERIAEEAACWVLCGDSAHARIGLTHSAWMEQSSRHRELYLEMRLLDGEIDALQPVDWQEVSDGARVDEPLDVQRRQVARYWAIAASFLMLLVPGSFYPRSEGWFRDHSYETRIGEARTVTFPEGSVAYLNTRTELRWSGTSRERRVELTQGEALFDVAHDAKRPFRVILDNSEIRVLGTRFNVYANPDSGSTVVTVVEGVVEVRGYHAHDMTSATWTRRLEANQQLEYDSQGLRTEPYVVDAHDTESWRDGLYLFKDKPLAHILSELNRYHGRRFVLRDPGLANFRLSGAIDIRNLGRALMLLNGLGPIDVQESGGVYFVHARGVSNSERTGFGMERWKMEPRALQSRSPSRGVPDSSSPNSDRK